MTAPVGAAAASAGFIAILPPDSEAAMLVMNDSLDIFTSVQVSFWGNFQMPDRPRCSFCFLTPSTRLDGI